MIRRQQGGRLGPPATPSVSDAWLSSVATSAATDARAPADLLGGYLPLLADAAINGRRPDTWELDAVRELGRRAAARGVGARRAVDLYLSAAWRLWRQLPAVARSSDQEKVRRAAEAVLRVLDDAIGVLVDGHEAERRDMIRSEEAPPAGRVRRRPAAGRRRRLPAGGAGRAVRHRPGQAAPRRAPRAVRRRPRGRPCCDGTGACRGRAVRRPGCAGGHEGRPRGPRRPRGFRIRPGPARGATAWARCCSRSCSGGSSPAAGASRPDAPSAAPTASPAPARRRSRPGPSPIGSAWGRTSCTPGIYSSTACWSATSRPWSTWSTTCSHRWTRCAVAPRCCWTPCPSTSTPVRSRPRPPVGSTSRAGRSRTARVADMTGYRVSEPDQRFALHAAVLGARLLEWPTKPLPVEP